MTVNGNSYSYIGFRPFEGTTCGSGRICKSGVCEKDSRVPTGDCLVPTNQTFCKGLESTWSKQGICKAFGNGVCCEYCDKNKKTIGKMSNTKTLDEILKSQVEDEVKVL